MKHITTLITLALTLGTLVPLAAQTKMTAKEKRTQTRQERKIAQQKVKEQLYQDAVRALENNYNPQIEMFARFKMKSSFHKTKRII